MSSPNAPLLRRTNLIKQNLSIEILTPPQRAAYDKIQNYVETGERKINLYGPSGVGKTVLCWVYAEENDWQYLSDTSLEATNTSVIFDHAGATREATRRLRAKMELKSISRIIYVTKTTAAELYPRVELNPGQGQQETIREQLRSLTENRSLLDNLY